MNKSELITAIAEHSNLTKADAGRALDGLIKTIETSLKAGDSVALVGFGTFEVKAAGGTPGPQSTKRRRDHDCCGENTGFQSR